MKILIIEDDVLVAMSMQTTLNVLGHSDVLLADTGEKGVEMVKEHNPEIVLMDIRLPGIDGIEAAKLINESSKDTVIVYVSAYSDLKTKEEVSATEYLDFLTKPVNKEEFKDLIEKVRELKGTDTKK